jgi:kinesin family protein 2/24
MYKTRSDKIDICVRKRPGINTDDIKIQDGKISLFKYDKKINLDPITIVHEFKFDSVFDEYSKNNQIYNDIIKSKLGNSKDLICYTYGQTGSGKTHTLFGSANNQDIGLIYLTLYDIIKISPITISCYEIYNGQLFDILNKRKSLNMCEGYSQEINIIGLKHIIVSDFKAGAMIIDRIQKQSRYGNSSQNNHSSRAHTIVILQTNKNKITFADLAGSERAQQSIFSNRELYRENSEINKSILALKECIRSIHDGKKHIPFRSSKLTLALRDAFSDKCLSVMISTISPDSTNFTDTLNTLRYTYDLTESHKKSAYTSNTYQQSKAKHTNQPKDKPKNQPKDQSKDKPTDQTKYKSTDKPKDKPKDKSTDKPKDTFKVSYKEYLHEIRGIELLEKQLLTNLAKCFDREQNEKLKHIIQQKIKISTKYHDLF